MHHLTQLELLHLQDYLKNEQLAQKCATFWADQCSDASIKQVCQDAAQTHKQNYQMMVKHLNASQFQ